MIGIFRGSNSYETLSSLFCIEKEFYRIEVGLYSTLLEQAFFEFLLDLSQKGGIESNSLHLKLISR